MKSDLDDLALLWREEQEDPAEQRELEQLARKARSRGKLMAYTDIAWVVMLVGGSVIALFAAYSPFLLVATILIILGTVWLTWKRRSIRQMTRSLNTSDRQGFLESSIDFARGSLRRNTLSLVTFPMIVPLAVLVKVATRSGGDPQAMVAGVLAWLTSPRGIIPLTVLAVMMTFVIRARYRIRAELRRLADLSRDYEEEARRDAEG